MVFKKGYKPFNKGKKISKKHKLNIVKSLIGNKRGQGNKGKSTWNKGLPKEKQSFYGHKHTAKTIKKISNSIKNLKDFHPNDKHFERILKEIPELEKQGFKCIPIGKPIPDIIGLKNGKVYAIEVQYYQRSNSKINYLKYNDDTKKYFDDVIWILRKY